MSEKYSSDYIKDFIEEKGYKWIDGDYKNTRTKLILECPEGHQFNKDFKHLKRGEGCPWCARKRYGKYRKYTYRQIKDFIESYGYELLSDEYKNVETKLTLKCPQGHQFEMNFSHFKREQRCPKCCSNRNKKLSDKEVREYIENCEYKWIDEEYINIHSKLLLQCPKGHQFKANFWHFKNGNRCPICYNENLDSEGKLDINHIRETIETRGYRWIEGEYKSSDNKLTLKCPKGHQFHIRFGNFKNGQGCPICSISNKTHSSEYVKNYIENEGYEWLYREYENAETKIILKCPKGHQFETNFRQFNSERRCPVCWAQSSSSKLEGEIQDITEQITEYPIIKNDRTTLKNPYTGRYLEFDIFIPDLNKAIEFNGDYWHSFDSIKERDKIKKDECHKNGIDLLVIEEEDYTNNKEEISKIIDRFINL